MANEELASRLKAFALMLKYGHDLFDAGNFSDAAALAVNNSRRLLNFRTATLLELSGGKARAIAQYGQVEANPHSRLAQVQCRFAESLKRREGAPEFVFFEGPPSANGFRSSYSSSRSASFSSSPEKSTSPGERLSRRSRILESTSFRFRKENRPVLECGILLFFRCLLSSEVPCPEEEKGSLRITFSIGSVFSGSVVSSVLSSRICCFPFLACQKEI